MSRLFIFEIGEGPWLSCPSRTHGDVPDLVQHAGELHAIQSFAERQQFGEEWIAGKVAQLLFAARLSASQQIWKGDFQRFGEAFERRESGCRLLVLNLGDVGARHLHAQGKLALAESGTLAQGADRECDLQLRMRRCRRYGDCRLGRRNHYFRFFRIERGAAFTAKVIVSTELDECASIASNHFPCINGSERRGHQVVEDARAVTSSARYTYCGSGFA
jgi:hypothetical protein